MIPYFDEIEFTKRLFKWLSVAWLVATAFFIIFAALVLRFKLDNDPLSIGIGALGLALAFFVNFVYCADKVNTIEENKKRDVLLKNLERICNQWDRERDPDLQV